MPKWTTVPSQPEYYSLPNRMSTCCWEMMPDSASSHSSVRSLPSSSGPRRKLRSAKEKALVSAAILQHQASEATRRYNPICARVPPGASACKRRDQPYALEASPTCHRCLSPSCLASSGKKVLLCRTYTQRRVGHGTWGSIWSAHGAGRGAREAGDEGGGLSCRSGAPRCGSC